MLSYLAWLVLTAIVLTKVTMPGEMQIQVGIFSIAIFPVIYIMITGLIIPIANRQFKTSGQRMLVVTLLIGLAIVALAIIPLVVPFLLIIVFIWFLLPKDSTNETNNAVGSNVPDYVAMGNAKVDQNASDMQSRNH